MGSSARKPLGLLYDPTGGSIGPTSHPSPDPTCNPVSASSAPSLSTTTTLTSGSPWREPSGNQGSYASQDWSD